MASQIHLDLFVQHGAFPMPASPLVTWKTPPYPIKAKPLSFTLNCTLSPTTLSPGYNSILTFSTSHLNDVFARVSFMRLGASEARVCAYLSLYFTFGPDSQEVCVSTCSSSEWKKWSMMQPRLHRLMKFNNCNTDYVLSWRYYNYGLPWIGISMPWV